MELEEAASRIQTMLNFYNGLRSLQELVDFARTIENIPKLEKERLALAEKARVKMESAQTQLAQFEVEVSRKIAEENSAFDALVSAHKSKISELDAGYASKQEALQRDLESAQAAYTNATGILNIEVAGLTTRRDELQEQIDKLEKALSTLKTKIANM